MTNETEKTPVHYLSLKEIQEAELNILKAFDKICRQEGLRYSLVGGTLLGAVRHKGFIPWDDDIDVAMPRPDYEKLRSRAKQLFASTHYEVIGYPDEGASDPVFSKLVDRGIVVKDVYRDGLTNLWIDIFPIDGLPSSDEEIQRIYGKAHLLRKLATMSYADRSEGKTPLRKAAKNVFYPFDKLFSIGKRCETALIGLAKAYPYEESGHIGCIVWGLYGPGEKLPPDAFDERTEMVFEDGEFPVMYCWDRYLTGIYGDYLTPPPESDRAAHEMHVWKVDI